ncbi:type III secretion translocon protein HrpF [Pseudomonas flavescens]|uniref:Type III secretion translocon protein HrpF n=1 Tax=Phytopseudomonas flavescens TaxID=29435 RepID=A0A1G8DK46_9GAMM|nr:HrpF/NolX family T3SS translocon protein [Pseudomonas flavescens]SDH57829.1 type III secretion translocon protein HrpF [Pseudomonas flavescens]
MRLSSFSPPNQPANLGMPPESPRPQPQAGAKPTPQGGFSISWQAPGSTQPQRPSAASDAGTQRRDNAEGQPGLPALDLILAFLGRSSDAGGKPPAAQCQSPAAGPAQEQQRMPFEEVVSILGRNENLLKKPLDREGLEKLRDDPKTPSDAKQALGALLDNPDYYAAFDQAKEGKADGKTSSKDVQKLQEHPHIRAYADAKAGQYTDNYVPSDAPPDAPGRVMTANDAMRELYLYSESLPKNISLDTLQNIADGSQKMGKCPPQLAAAAKFFVQNPDQWQAFSGKSDPSGSVSRDRLSDLAAFNVKLSPQENSALETLKNNKDIFFKGGGITPEKLESIANNKENSQEVRDTANLLAQPNSMLFSMLDNGKHGAGGNFFNKANDRNIGKGDLDAFISKGSNQVADAPLPSSRPVASAQKDMAAGQETQPDAKKEKGGGFSKFLDIFSYVASGLMMLIPGAGVAGAAMAAGRVAATAVGRTVATTAAKEATKEAATQVGKQTTRQALTESAKQGARDGFKEGLKDGAKDFGKEAAKDLAKEGIDRYRNRDEERVASNPNIEQPRVWAQG